MSAVHRRHWPGDPDRPAVALHCMLGSAGYWGPIARLLEGRIDLTGFDMPGHGRSAQWLPGRDDPDYHTAVTRMAAAFIDRPVDLVGHSMGGTVALRIAVAAPQAVRSLTLIEPVLFAAAPDPDQTALDKLVMDEIAAGRADQAVREFLSVWGDQGYDDLDPAAQQKMQQQIKLLVEVDKTMTSDSANILRDGGLESIDAPVLLISGADSPPVVQNIAEALAARMGDVGLATVPDAGHMLPITHPEQVAGLIAVNLDRA